MGIQPISRSRGVSPDTPLQIDMESQKGILFRGGPPFGVPCQGSIRCPRLGWYSSVLARAGFGRVFFSAHQGSEQRNLPSFFPGILQMLYCCCSHVGIARCAPVVATKQNIRSYLLTRTHGSLMALNRPYASPILRTCPHGQGSFVPCLGTGRSMAQGFPFCVCWDPSIENTVVTPEQGSNCFVASKFHTQIRGSHVLSPSVPIPFCPA